MDKLSRQSLSHRHEHKLYKPITSKTLRNKLGEAKEAFISGKYYQKGHGYGFQRGNLGKDI
jgi:hypothetical protein